MAPLRDSVCSSHGERAEFSIIVGRGRETAAARSGARSRGSDKAKAQPPLATGLPAKGLLLPPAPGNQTWLLAPQGHAQTPPSGTAPKRGTAGAERAPGPTHTANSQSLRSFPSSAHGTQRFTCTWDTAAHSPAPRAAPGTSPTRCQRLWQSRGKQRRVSPHKGKIPRTADIKAPGTSAPLLLPHAPSSSVPAASEGPRQQPGPASAASHTKHQPSDNGSLRPAAAEGRERKSWNLRVLQQGLLGVIQVRGFYLFLFPQDWFSTGTTAQHRVSATTLQHFYFGATVLQETVW